MVGDILINITSSDKGETKTLVDLGLLDILLPILQSKDYEGEMFDTVFWMVANITGKKGSSVLIFQYRCLENFNIHIYNIAVTCFILG